MKLKTRLCVVFLAFTILPIVFLGIVFSMGKLFMLYRFDDF